METLFTVSSVGVPIAKLWQKQSPFSWRLSSKTTRKSFLSFPLPFQKPPTIVCMAEPYLLVKLDSAERTWRELSVKLADPDVVANPSEYQKLAQSMAELDEVVATYRKFKDCEKQLEETKALAKVDSCDQEMAEMIASEIESLSNQLKELEERLKVNDPKESTAPRNQFCVVPTVILMSNPFRPQVQNHQKPIYTDSRSKM